MSKRKRMGCDSKREGKACDGGKISRNPFFNFLRTLRVKHCDWSVVQIAVAGGKRWREMSDNEKEIFRQQAKAAPFKPYKKRNHKGRKPRNFCSAKSKSHRKRSPKHGKRHRGKTKRAHAARKKSCKPGTVTINPFFNFLRKFRKQHCDWSIVEVAVEGAKDWSNLSDKDKIRFKREATKAPPYKRKKGKFKCNKRR